MKQKHPTSLVYQPKNQLQQYFWILKKTGAEGGSTVAHSLLPQGPPIVPATPHCVAWGAEQRPRCSGCQGAVLLDSSMRWAAYNMIFYGFFTKCSSASYLRHVRWGIWQNRERWSGHWLKKNKSFHINHAEVARTAQGKQGHEHNTPSGRNMKCQLKPNSLTTYK